MKLLLTSNGIANESIATALREMVGKPTKEANFVFVTTGSNPVRGDKTWLKDDISRAHDVGWKSFEIIDVAVVGTWRKDLWWRVFENADVIMFCGGHAQYLSYWLQKSGLMDELPKLLEQNKVYIGISAGGMVATESLRVSSNELAKLAPEADRKSDKNAPEEQELDQTLKLVEFAFRPHFNSPNFPMIREDFMRKVAAEIKVPLYVADDETAVRVVDGKVDVVSEGKWLLLD